MMKKNQFFPWLMMASLKFGARKNLYFFGARPELKLGAQTKLREKAQTYLWGYPEEGGLLNFEDE